MNINTFLSIAAGAAIMMSAYTTMGSSYTSMGSGPSSMSTAPVRVEGGILVNTDGMTLYTFDRDPSNFRKSMCNGRCAKNWPPLLAFPNDIADDDWSIIHRDDESLQWAYKGKPLYLWSLDKKPGDKTGDGLNNLWHVARY